MVTYRHLTFSRFKHLCECVAERIGDDNKVAEQSRMKKNEKLNLRFSRDVLKRFR